MLKVSDLGEFGLIRRIAASLPLPPGDVLVGIGDDVAVLQTSGEEVLLATCDAQVENVHFIRDRITPYQLGRKTIAINVSDIAAMGGKPAWALVSLALPPDLDVSFVDGLYAGMRDQIGLAGGAVVGGNLSRTRSELVIDLCLLGRADPSRVLLRNGAREGDLVLVTGTLGDSRAGLEILLRPELAVTTEARKDLSERHLTPQPRLAEGQTLARSGMVHAMVDVSDGLAADIGHICNASGVGAEIHEAELPISSACREAALAAGKSAADWALHGGEDYELLFTAASENAAEIRRVLKEETGTCCRVIGEIIGGEASVQILGSDGKRTTAGYGSGGWDHFAGS